MTPEELVKQLKRPCTADCSRSCSMARPPRETTLRAPPITMSFWCSIAWAWPNLMRSQAGPAVGQGRQPPAPACSPASNCKPRPTSFPSNCSTSGNRIGCCWAKIRWPTSTIEHEHLRQQLERELKGHLLTLRERYLLTGRKPQRVAELLTSSVAGFLVVVPRSLAAVSRRGARVTSSRPSAAGDPYSFRPAAASGDRRFEAPAGASSRQLDPQSLFESYATTIEQVAEAIDRRLHP